jgi:DNA-binding XRE family transcriptional regulator
MSMQIIERNGKPEWAVVPYEEYLQLVEQAEMLQDIRDYDAVKEALERGDEELVPSQVVYAILDGENPVRVLREFRGMSQKELAESAGISVPYLSQLEKGKRKGTLEVLSAIAKTLQVLLDDVVNY